MKKETTKHSSFLYPLFIGLATWYSWVIVMWKIPSLNEVDSLLRAFIRIGALLIPALIYSWKAYGSEMWTFLGFRNVKSGFIWGGSFSLFLILINVLLPMKLGYTFIIPTTLTIWINHIIGSPFAEEILFRSVVFQELSRKTNVWKSTLISSLLFVILHVPKWILLNELGLMMLMKRSAYIFVVGIIFTVLFHKSKSLLGSLIPHSIHNLISMSISK